LNASDEQRQAVPAPLVPPFTTVYF
jgi:hypothetical protein